MRFLLAIFLILAPSALADESAQLTAFTEGRYFDAVLLADQQPTADNLAFAARSLLAEAMSAPDFEPPETLIDQAETYARRALAADAQHVEARLQLAIALSLRARPMSTGEAMKTGYGGTAHDLAESVLADDPGNVYAHGFLAVWNLEVVRRGGGLGATMMGASVKTARRHYRAALASDPEDASVHWQYAKALTALNARRYRDEIDAALSAALVAETESELETLMQDRARALAQALETQSHASCEKLAERML